MFKTLRPRTSSLRALLQTLAPSALLALAFPGALAYAQQPVAIAGVTAVGSSAPAQAISLVLAQGGSLGSIKVLTQGSPNYDFTASPGSTPSGGVCTLGINYLPGQQCSVMVTFSPTYPGQRGGAVVLLDGNNNPLATQAIVANATGAVATFVPGTITTVAGNTAWIYAGDGGLATQSSIFLPFGFAVDGAGDIFLADSSNNRIRRVDAVTGIISTVAGNGLIGYSGDGGPATVAALSNPSSVALDSSGNIFISDSGNNLVRRIDAFTGIITTVAGSVNLHGYGGDNGPATQASLNTPNGIAIDVAGDLYIADTGNNAVRMVNSSTGVITTVAGNGAATFSGDSGLATSSSLYNPWSVTLDTIGDLYIADQNNNRIRMVSPAGIITTVAGNGISGFSGDAGPATLAELNVPASVAIDVAGNIYVADSGNNRVRKISAQTGNIDTIAGNGGQSFAGDNGPADQSGLYGPYTLALDGQGSLFIADVFHNRIRKVAANSGTLLFPPQRVGRVSTALTQTIENDGNAPLLPQSLIAVSNSQVDPLNSTCLNMPIAPLSTCVISAQFVPTTIGQLVTGLIDMTSNAANAPSALTLTGQVLNTDPSTVAIASSANPSITGARVNFAVNVSSAGTTPTGVVTLLDGSLVLATATLGTGGNVSFSISGLTSGDHTITAAYAGDTSNAAGQSAPLIQVVNDIKAATVTLLATSASPINAGASLRLTATVAVATPDAASGTPTGSVSFLDGNKVLGTTTLNSGTATLAITTLSVGTHSLKVSYAGDTNFAVSTSSAVTETVNLAATQMSISTNANPSNSGAPLTLTATIFSNGGVPTGSIALFDSGKPLGTANINGQGIATLVVPGGNWTVGTHILTATYAGDLNDGGCTAQPVSQQVNLAGAALLLASSSNPAPLGGSVTFSVTATSNGGTPTGAIQFLDGGTAIGSGMLNPAGVATFATSSLALGTHTLTATYNGDGYDSGAVAPSLSQLIQPTSVTVSLISSANPANFGSPLTFSAAVTGTGMQPGGTVVLTDAGSPLTPPLLLDANGNASFTTSALIIGPHTILASYSGDATHAGQNSAVLNQRVVQTTATSLAMGSPHVIAGLPASFTAAVTGANGKPITGPIALMDGAKLLATLTPDQTGSASYSTAALAPGTHTLTANFAGDTFSGASSSLPALQTIDMATTTTTLAASANPAFTNTPLTLTANVSGNGAALTGNVTFLNGSTTIAIVPLSNGIAVFTTSTLTAGIHTLVASYSGDTNDSPSKSASLSQQVAAQTSVVITSPTNPSLLTDNVTLSIAVNNGATISATGVVTLTDNGSPLGTPVLDATGRTTFTMTAPAIGKHLIVATYAGDAENVPGSSPAFTQTVVLRPTTTSFTASSTSLSAGQQLILISVVQGSGPAPPTGTVTFQSGSTSLGTVPLTAGGIATITLTPPQQTLNAVAVYSGDSLYATSTSPIIGILIGPPIEFTVTTPGTLSMASGDHNTLAITVATAPTFADTLGFGCAGLPQYSTCVFSTTTMAVTGGVTKTLSVVVDTGDPLGAGAEARNSSGSFKPNTGPLLCLLPAALLLALLRRKRLPLKLLTLLLTTAAAVASLSGCSTNFHQGQTAPGSYTFQIVANGDKSGATGTANVQLTVSQ